MHTKISFCFVENKMDKKRKFCKISQVSGINTNDINTELYLPSDIDQTLFSHLSIPIPRTLSLNFPLSPLPSKVKLKDVPKEFIVPELSFISCITRPSLTFYVCLYFLFENVGTFEIPCP